jgi:3-hydroxyisobutyrate dehydrogenase-like beta-hydroxyacid dehydrogenase
MQTQADNLALIGFGEAAATFVEGFRAAGWPEARLAALRAYDRKTDFAETRASQQARMAGAGIIPVAHPEAAVHGAQAVLCLVTADQSVQAARAAAPHLAEGALWLDMNSVAPQTKRIAAALIHAAGARYVDVAVMAPVRPQRLGVPLLVAGPHAQAGLAALQTFGFSGRVVGAAAGDAAAIKMIRSIAIKGMEAVAAECVLCATAAGVADEVFGSLERSNPELRWRDRALYSLERMMVHGLRRGEEMEEAAATAAGLGLGGTMAAATAALQHRIGALRVAPRPVLEDAAADLLAAWKDHTA